MLDVDVSEPNRRTVLTILVSVLVAVALSGCSGIAVRGEFTPIGVYGESANATPAVSSPQQIKVYYKSAPDGFTLTNNQVEVLDGYDHEILGDISVVYDKGFCDMGQVTQAQVMQRLQQAAYKRGANAVVFATSQVSKNPTVSAVCSVVQQGGEFGHGWAVRLTEGADGQASN